MQAASGEYEQRVITGGCTLMPAGDGEAISTGFPAGGTRDPNLDLCTKRVELDVLQPKLRAPSITHLACIDDRSVRRDDRDGRSPELRVRF